MPLRIQWGRPIGRTRIRPVHLGIGGAVVVVAIIIIAVAVSLASPSATVSVRALSKTAPEEEQPSKPVRLLTNKSKTRSQWNRLLKKTKAHDSRRSPWRL